MLRIGHSAGTRADQRYCHVVLMLVEVLTSP